jgi:hypothetical protein
MRLANAIGFVAAVVQNYLLNYSWTFRDKQSSRTKARWVQASQFALVSLIGLAINALVREIVSYLFIRSGWLLSRSDRRRGGELQLLDYCRDWRRALLELRRQPAVDVPQPGMRRRLDSHRD